ncbi:NAD(P)/FAD-dependent oxidoreductase [Agromyces protaetiae]|uniref:NAD(P)/FAD-dependent oxidoreductase n=1 Tax=Agromyces protaetiae TaxID=2509455 RepID=A0A4P6FC08_9MICO|nr:FAD-dependent oxidoreductase [Agromyces protaetiae]QAY73315.1 NAD(P)/FAD-dependent oxidoreductase [Agromyces protaetiae]
MSSRERIIVVGGGLAAARAVESARASGYDGALVVVTDEPRLPYERPPLSKGYLLGKDPSSSAYPLDAAWYRTNDVEVRRSTTAEALDVSKRTLLAGGEPLGYDRLLIATGASPRRFGGPGAGLRGVRHLRRLPDATALKRELGGGGSRVVVAGGGWIGLEVAAAAREYGNDVTVVIRGQVPLAGAIGEKIGRVFLEMHKEHGVRFVTGASVTAVRGRGGRVASVVLDTRNEPADELPADLVLFGIGATPNVGLAASAGLELAEGGIATDAGFATSADGVYAAGDVAAVWNDRLGHHLRVDHWANADAGGRAAGRALAGESVHYDEIPYFYTDQYDLGMEYSGYGELAAADGVDVVVRGDLAKREFVAFWVADGAVVAGMNVNVWDVNDDVQRLIRSGAVVPPQKLADLDIPLAALAGAGE